MASGEAYDDVWTNVPWKKFQKILARLQYRIYKAALNNDYNKVVRLQNLLVNSSCARLIAVRQASDLVTKKEIAYLTDVEPLLIKERFNVVKELTNVREWRYSKFGKFSSLGSTSRRRNLNVFNLMDKAFQFLIQYALDPYYEAITSFEVMNVRIGDYVYDTQNTVFRSLRSTCHNPDKRVLKINIDDCFDNIDYGKLLSFFVVPTKVRCALSQAFRAGLLLKRHPVEEDTVQDGGLLSLLTDIALSGLEELHDGVRCKDFSNTRRNGFRYFNDVLYLLGGCTDYIHLKTKIDNFLRERGFPVDGVRITLATFGEGFDFLGWHFKVTGSGRFIHSPTGENVHTMIEESKRIIKSTSTDVGARIQRLTYVYAGWLSYYRPSRMLQIRASLWALTCWVARFICRNIERKLKRRKFQEAATKLFTGGLRMNGVYSKVGKDNSIYTLRT